jgi:hypothetical protein
MVGRPEVKRALGWAVAAWAGAALWVLSPVDVVPDVLPVLGWLDDLAVLVGVSGFTAWLLARPSRAGVALPPPAVEPAEPERGYDPVPVDELRSW